MNTGGLLRSWRPGGIPEGILGGILRELSCRSSFRNPSDKNVEGFQKLFRDYCSNPPGFGQKICRQNSLVIYF